MKRTNINGWFRMDNRFYEDETIVKLSHAAQRLFKLTIAYSSRNTTDGRIPRAVMHTLYSPIDHANQTVALTLDFKHVTTWTPSGSPVITARALRGARQVSVADTIEELIRNGLVHALDTGDYKIVNYLKWQESKATIDNRRQKDTERKRKERPNQDEEPEDSERNPSGIQTESEWNPSGIHMLDPDTDIDLSLSLKNAEIDPATTAIDDPEPRERENGKTGIVYTAKEFIERGIPRFGKPHGDQSGDLERLAPFTQAEWSHFDDGPGQTWRYVINGLPGFRATSGSKNAAQSRVTGSPVNGSHEVYTAPPPPDENEQEAGAREAKAIRERLENHGN